MPNKYNIRQEITNRINKLSTPSSSVGLSSSWIIFGLVAPLIANAIVCAPQLYLTWISPDTTVFYFPFAQRLSENFGGFFNHPDSLWTAPGTSVYMSLAGLNYEAIKTTNFALTFAVLLMLFHGALRLGGPMAASASAWLYAIYPPLTDFKVSILSEAPFVFLTIIYIWLSICATRAAHADQPDTRRKFFSKISILGAGLALAAATLTRGIYLYWIPVAIVVFFALHAISRDCKKIIFLKLIIIHAVACVLIIAYMTHVQLTFGRFAIANGTGIALYLGSNPSINGFDPVYMGLTYDSWTMTVGQHHLTDESDKNFLAAAKASLLNTGFFDLTKMYYEKFGSFLFFSKVHLPQEFGNHRSWRIALLIFALIGAIRYRSLPVILSFSGIIIYLTSVHTPLLYTARYSIGSIDIFLILLAGLGVATCVDQKNRFLNSGKAFVVVIFGIALGQWHHRYSSPVLPDISKGASFFISAPSAADIEIHGFNESPFNQESEVIDKNPSITWKNSEIYLAGTSIINVSSADVDRKCRNLKVVFKRENSPPIEKTVNIRNLEHGRNIGVGTSVFIAQPPQKGDLIFIFDCPVGSKLKLGGLGLHHASIGLMYRDGLLSK